MATANTKITAEAKGAAEMLARPIQRHEQRIGDLEKAVLELASVAERLVVGGARRSNEERAKMLFAIDNARALATPEDGDDDPEPAPSAPSIAPRYWIDDTAGDGEASDELAYVAAQWRAGRVRHASDRLLGALVVYNGLWQEVGDAADAA